MYQVFITWERAGWTDCVLLEKNELTAGSTWHAAGNCPTFSDSWAVFNMQRYSVALYRGLAEEAGYPISYNVTGSLRLGHTTERMQEFERVAGMGRRLGLRMEVCTPNELQDHCPFLEIHDLVGGLWDPFDGDIDPAQLTQALAKVARDLGQKIIRFTPATGVSRKGEEWIVHTEKGDIGCQYVVNAAGYYAHRVGEWFKPYGGRTVPMTVMSHQYLLTEEIPELEVWTKKNGRKLPLIRDVDTSYYLRQEKHGLNLGPYERNCKAHWIRPDDPMPDDFSFQLYPDDLDRLEWYIEDAMARVPILGAQGVSRVINGPIPYAPDGLPLIGPMPGVKNAFEAHSFTFGITQAGGAGKVLAEWIAEGETEWDMWAVDPRRYTDYTDQDYCAQKAIETYGNEYAMHYPHHEWPAGRGKKHSTIHDKLEALGAQFGAVNGWERANWFAQKGDDTSEDSTKTWRRDGSWEQRVREECEAVRDNVGVLDLCGFSRYVLSGNGAAAWLHTQITGTLPRIGRISLGYFADSKGRVVTEMTIMRVDKDKFILIAAAPAQWHDFEVLSRNMPEGFSLVDRTAEFDTLVVTGPKSRDLFAKISDADLQLPWLTHQKANVAGRPARMVRVSYAGELGWEIHARNGDIPAIFDAVIDAGATPYGMFALNSLRLEKGYRSWKGDLSTAYTALECGLGRFIKWDKPEFTGKQALENERQQGSKKRFAPMIVETKDYDAPYMSTIWHDEEMIGETTSAGFGYRIDKSIAFGMLKLEFTRPGTRVDIEIYGKRYKATVQEDCPLWDPDNARLRA